MMIFKPVKISVSSGKGGVGKTAIARQMAIVFASTSNRVCIREHDETTASCVLFSNLPTWALTGKRGVLIEKMSEGKLTIVHSLDGEQKDNKFDVIIYDIPSYLITQKQDVFTDADIPIMITSPDPESVFAMLETSSKIVTRNIFVNCKIAHEDYPSGKTTPPLTPQDLLEAEHISDENKQIIKRLLNKKEIGFIVNMVDGYEDELGWVIECFARAVLSLPLVYIGGIGYDETAKNWVSKCIPAHEFNPNSKFCTDVEKIARVFISAPEMELIKHNWRLPVDDISNYYTIVQASFVSPEFEIQRNYKKLKDGFILMEATFGKLLGKGERIKKVYKILEEAYSVLSDADSRKSYTSMLEAKMRTQPGGDDEGVDKTGSSGKVAYREVRGQVTGSFLRKKRLELGLGYPDLASITKIGVKYLRAIEEENYVDLPSMVYVKGFLKEIAKVLGLDPEKVAFLYTKRVKDGIRED